jgi:hypothetical protein
VKFPVPWGHIAGREWGDPQGKHVLALHGEQRHYHCTVLSVTLTISIELVKVVIDSVEKL